MKTIFILGMHRSGTSAMAGVLNKLGCYSGIDSDLLDTDRRNALGYFERKDVVNYNEKILSEQFIKDFPEIKDLDYFDDINKLDNLGWLFGSWCENLEVKLESTLKEIEDVYINIKKIKDSTDKPLVIKEPRMSLTFPVWKKYFDINDPVILMIRNPLNVAKSLYERDKILQSISFEVWEKYTRKALEHTQDNPRMLVNYDNFIDNPESVIKKVIDFLIANNVNIDKKNIDNSIKFINSNMRHQNSNYTNIPVCNIYKYLQENGLNKIESIEWSKFEDQKSWEKALLQVFYLKLQKKELEVKHVKNILLRLNNHPVCGAVIRLIRYLKKDRTFGEL